MEKLENVPRASQLLSGGARIQTWWVPRDYVWDHSAHHLRLNEMTLLSSLVPGGVCPSSISILAMKCPNFSFPAYQPCDPSPSAVK